LSQPIEPSGDPNHTYLVLHSETSNKKVVLQKWLKVTIGRQGNSVIVIDSDKVSRQHAEIRWDGSGYSIFDNNATNGTFVNGRRVHKRTRLRPPVTISVGNQDLQLLGTELPDQDIDRREAFADQHDTKVLLNYHLAGLIERIGFPDLLQLLTLSHKTGKLQIFTPGNPGSLWIEDGQVIHAEFGEEVGRPAALSLLGLGAGRFEFQEEAVAQMIPRSIQQPPHVLLMEAASRES